MRAQILIMGPVLAILVLAGAPAHGQSDSQPDGPTASSDATGPTPGAIDAKIAVMSFDALGMDAEIVERLESLFRMELARLAKYPLPSRRVVDQVIQGSRRLRGCAGKRRCLALIGKALSVDVIVSGHVAALGDSYILNIKAIESKSGKELRRLSSDPLRGNPDELIDAMRVAAYRLLAPEELLGSIAVLTDLVGAAVVIDGKEVGQTPLQAPISGLALGDHEIRVTAKEFMPFTKSVEVRFQKTSRVVVRLVQKDNPKDPLKPIATPRPKAPAPWYTSTWFAVGVGVAAGITGGYVGYKLGRDPIVNCGAQPQACRAP